MLTDGQGMPRALAIDGANRHDMKLVCNILANLAWGRPQPTARYRHYMCMDKGFDLHEVRDLVAGFGLTTRICSGSEEAKAPPTPGRLPGPPPGRRTCARLGKSMPRLPRSLDEEGRGLLGVSALGLRHDHSAGIGPTGIGS